MAIKTISQFPSGIPTNNDYILFEQNGEGKSATIGDAVNTCSLSYEEIMATTDLTGKVASASAVRVIESVKKPMVIGPIPLDPGVKTYTFTLRQDKIYLLAGTHQGGSGTFLTLIGTYTGNISITHIKVGDLVTVTSSGLELSITFQYGHVWSLVQLNA